MGKMNFREDGDFEDDFDEETEDLREE